jgi:hypothetical protein
MALWQNAAPVLEQKQKMGFAFSRSVWEVTEGCQVGLSCQTFHSHEVYVSLPDTCVWRNVFPACLSISLLAELVPTPLIWKPVIGRDPEPVPSTFHLHNMLFLTSSHVLRTPAYENEKIKILKKRLLAHWDYSGISNCRTKILAIFRGKIFRGISKYLFIPLLSRDPWRCSEKLVSSAEPCLRNTDTQYYKESRGRGISYVQ